MDEKYLRYRAAKISKAEDISLEDALEIARQEVVSDNAAEKKLKVDRFKALSKKRRQKLKRNNKKTIYVVGDRVIDRVVQGGLPTLGKKH